MEKMIIVICLVLAGFVSVALVHYRLKGSHLFLNIRRSAAIAFFVALLSFAVTSGDNKQLFLSIILGLIMVSQLFLKNRSETKI